MPASSGSLLVSLGLNAADFIQGLTKAQYQTQQALGGISKQIHGVGETFKHTAELIGIGFGVHEVKEWGSAILEDAETLHHLQIETGSSIEDISKLQNITVLSGKSFEAFKPIIDRFTAALGAGGDSTTQVSEALAALGIKTQDPIKAILQVGEALDKYSDGAKKTALIKELFPGRGGIAFAATLQAIAENQDIVATKTDEQVRHAVELEESYRRLTIQSHALRDAFLDEIVPALGDMITRFLEARKGSDDLFDALKVWAQFNPFANATENLDYFDREIAKLEEKAKNPTFLGFKVGVSDQLLADLERLKKAREIAVDEQAKKVGGFPTNAPPPGKKPEAPHLPPKGQAEAILNRQLQQDIKKQEDAIREEQDALKQREHFLDSYYRDDLIGLDQYYAERQQALETAQRNILADFDAEIAAINKYKAAARKPEDVIKADTQLNDTLSKRNKAEQDFKTQNFDIGAQRARDIQQYTDALDELTAKLAEVAGAERDAAEIRFDIQNRSGIAKATFAGDQSALDRYAQLRKIAGAQADINVASEKYQLIQDALADTQARINLAVDAGTSTTLDGINKRSAAALKYADVLSGLADAQERAAKELPQGLAQDVALSRVAQLRLAIDQLKESANELEKTFRATFVDAFSEGLVSIIEHTKSVSQAFKDMGKQIVNQIDQIAAKNISETLFGKSGIGGGIPEFFAKAFGGGNAAPATGGAAPAAATTGGGIVDKVLGFFGLGGSSGSTGAGAVAGAGADTAVAGLATSAVAATTALSATDAATVAFTASATGAAGVLSALTAAATSASAALSAVAASSGGSAAASVGGDVLSSLFDSGGNFAFAEGGPVVANRTVLVGEKGPELFRPNAAGNIIPNHVLEAKSVTSRVLEATHTHNVISNHVLEAKRAQRMFSAPHKPFGGAFAEGGSVSAGKTVLVGEKGPELFSPYAAGKIVPNDQLMNGTDGRVYHIPVTVNVPQGTTRQSAAQIGLRTATELNRTLVRDG